MTDEISTLYAQILGETAAISWPELERFFAKGIVMSVASELDLVAVGEAISNDDKTQVQSWMEQGLLHALQDQQALDYQERNPNLWAVVISPWILVQERN